MRNVTETATARPTVDELVERAAALVPMLRERAATVEAERRVSPQTIAAFQEAGLFRLMQPAPYGGYEHDFAALVRVGAEIARGCGASGWVYTVLAFHNWQVGLFPAAGQDAIWGTDRAALIASSYAASGTAAPVDGGFRLTGKWAFASGCDNADWMVLGAAVQGAQGFDGRWFLVPRGEFVIDDNWHVSGLAGTGSKNIIVEDQFVPAARVCGFEDATLGTAPGAAVHTNPLYRIPFFAVASYCLIAPALGIAQGALEHYVGQTRGRYGRGARMEPNAVRLIDLQSIQMRVSEAAGLIDAARLLLLRDCAETLRQVADGGELAMEQRAINKRDQAMAAKFCKDAVRLVFEAAGGAGLYAENPLQRASRDVHAVGCHLTLGWDPIMPVHGRVMFGLPPGVPL